MPRDAADTVEMLLKHWQILSFYFPMIEMKLVQLEKRAEHTAFAVAKMKATITEHTLHHAFPHLVNRCTWSPLALKLLNTRIVISESVHFEWDNDQGCITKIRHSSDLLTPLLQLLGNLEDVALVFDKARVSPEGQVH
ncbi:hypothetical protein PHMEG_00030053 [Phytophthora megakarya]|uniref:Bzip transcription factor n=1 Tax=Phytophthora megakarya TaxID=4795 RepID=A0A225V175_9STRA|nr:hypothetical protein PHMEG_00030053 [Phytophthora megakarya]